jgi:S1-C subfamily serine protease
VDKSGVVLIEQAGRVAALGMVLNGDGRVLTALSRVTPGQLFVRYANGTLEAARVGHSDPARDLALLVPKTARWQKGVLAARDGLASGSSSVVGFSLGANRTLSESSQTLAGIGELAGHPVLKLGAAPKPNELGSPLLDPRGDALGIVVSGCAAGAANCGAPAVGLPVSEIRAFLRARPETAGYALPRLGVGGLGADTGVVRGLIITTVEAKSPASTLGLRVGTDPSNADLLVAVAGTPVPNEGALRNELARHAGGDRVELLVYGKDGYRVLNTRLAAPTTPPAAPSAPAASSASSPTDTRK